MLSGQIINRVSNRAGHRRSGKQVLALAAAMAGAALTAPLAHAADIHWIGPTGDDYNTPADWDANKVPNGDNAINSNGTVINILPTDPAWTVNDIRAGDSSNTTGTYNQSGSTVTLNGWFRIATAGTGSSGTYNLLGGSVVIPGGAQINIGEQGTGVLNVSNASFNVNNTGNSPTAAGNSNGAVGTINIGTGGTYTTLNSEFWSGNGGNGDNSSPNNYATGFVNVSSGGTLNVGSWLVAGRFGGHGTYNVTGTGVVNKNGGGNVQIGAGKGSIGIVNMSDQSQWNINGGDFQTGANGDTNVASVGIFNMTGQVGAGSEKRPVHYRRRRRYQRHL